VCKIVVVTHPDGSFPAPPPPPPKTGGTKRGRNSMVDGNFVNEFVYDCEEAEDGDGDA
jgi:hypothetical protein